MARLRSVASRIEAVDAHFESLDAARLSLSFASDLLPAMRAVANLIMAAEVLEEAAGLLRQDARAALGDVMALGATQFETEAHVISVKDSTRSVIITDAEAVPPDLWSTPEPKPDKTEIGKLLRRGERVPGAELANFTRPVVTIKAKEHA